jgi:hypothetical protein
MKKIIAAAAFATLVASPAFAQSYDPSVGSGNIAPHAQASTLQLNLHRGAHAAYAQVPTGGAAIVHFSGRHGASDPDANLRFQLNRESLQGRW